MEISNNSTVSPQVRYLTEIIADISKGIIRVPNFQRPYVWRQSDVVGLFDSIYKGYPIGSLLFWETDKKLESFPKIGSFVLPLTSKNEINYILDGHQRISSLFGVLYLNSADQNSLEETSLWNLFFDLQNEEFQYVNQSHYNPYLLPMNKVISTISFLDECKRIQNIDDKDSTELINRAQKLAQSILTYKIAIIQIKGGDLNSAVEIFSRLNTRGLNVTADQMLSALTYKEGKEGFKLSDRIDEILEKIIEYRFSDLERIFIFRTIIAALQKDIYKAKLEDLAKEKRINLPEIVAKSETAIVHAANFLYNELNIPGDKLLPYNLQFVFLSEFFFNCHNPSDQKKKELERWFWITSYSGWFAGANSSKVKKGLDAIREFAKTEEETTIKIDYDDYTVEFPDKFDFRYARVKTHILFLLSLNPRNLESGEILNGKELLSESGSKALHYILPTFTDHANRIILGPVKYGYAKKILLDESFLYNSEILASHAITPKALDALKQGNGQDFLNIRQSELERLEEIFIKRKDISNIIPFNRSPVEKQLDLFVNPSTQNFRGNSLRKFVITQSHNGEYRFKLRASNGEVLLVSEGYISLSGCENGINSVKVNSQLEDRFEKKTSTNSKHYFNLKASNGQIIGTSEMFESSSARDNSITVVMAIARDAIIEY